MGIITDMLFSYVNSKGKTVKGVRFSSGTNDRFAFEVYSQPAIRLHAVLSLYGKDILGILDKFAAGQPYKAGKGLVSAAEYNGHDLIVFANQDGDKNALRMGKGKAGKVAGAIKAHGLDSVVATLVDVIGDAKPMDSKPPRKGGKGKGQGGKGGAPKADVEAEADVEVEVDDEVADQKWLDGLARPSSPDGRIAQNEARIVALFDEITRLQAETRALKAASLAIA